MANLAIMPRLSLNEETNLLSMWYVKEGDSVSVGDKLFCIETDKSTMDVDSEFAGVVLKRYYDDYAVVQVLAPVCAIGEAGETAPEIAPAAAELKKLAAKAPAESEKAPTAAAVAPVAPTAPAKAAATTERRFASPRAKAAAAQNGVTSFASIPASGAEGRILEQDVLAFLAGGAKQLLTMENCETVRFTKIRSVIAKNMVASLQNSAQLTLNAVFNASALQALRAKFKKEQGKYKDVTIGDLIVYGTARTLNDFPAVNAWVGADELTKFDIVNIGVAVDTERGLMVPTILNAGEKDLCDISAETKELAAACHAGNLAPEKMQNATFTVSNLGAFGIESFTPVINPPQAAILGVGSIGYATAKTESGMLTYPACHLSLTLDHRALDGAPAARFLKKLCENLAAIDRMI